MDEYIYDLPPPPPPAGGIPVKRGKWETEAGEWTDASAKKTRSGTDGDLLAVSPAVREASEDVDRWIAERRKNWPSASRVLEKQREVAAQPRRPDPQPSPASDSKRNICRYFAQGKCRSGAKCKFRHETATNSPVTYKRFEAPVKSSLFKRLVQADMDVENSKILDFIAYLDTQGLLV